MPVFRIAILILTLLLFLTVQPDARTSHTVTKDLESNSTIFVISSGKGPVRFDHDLHIREMKAEACKPCHKTAIPTKENTMSRFDQHSAHYFCKGCHRDKERGPVECHECHKVNQ